MAQTLVEVVSRQKGGRPRLRRFFVEASDNAAAWQTVARRFTLGGEFAGESIIDGYVTSDPYRVAVVKAAEAATV
jgi:hypothetical protein